MPILKNTLNPFSAARTSLAIATFALVTAGTLCVAGPAVAAQTCSSTISNSTVPVDVVVSGRCVISGSTVEGGVSVQPGATLVVVNSSVQGAVKGEQPKEIEIKGSNLDKGISIVGGIDVLKLISSTVDGGDVTASGAKSVVIVQSSLLGGLVLKDDSRQLSIRDSTVAKGLSCNRGMSYQAIGSTLQGKTGC